LDIYEVSGFELLDSKGLALIMTIYRKLSKDPFPLDYLFDNWKNTSGQLSFLKLAVAAPPDVFNFANSSRRIDVEGLPSIGKNVGAVNQVLLST
jgi:CCR4-NOT transcription complex subunit 1